MKQFFKYPGGKRREIKNIIPYISKKTERIIEPFAGAAVLSLYAEKPAIISDVNDDSINLFNVIKNSEDFLKLQQLISETNISSEDKDANKFHLEKLYYQYRDDEWGNTDPVIKAYRFLLLRQLCFSGMYRINQKTGKFNVPFGWYNFFNTSLSTEHHNLLQSWNIIQGDFSQALSLVKENDFVFLDPPYFERNSAYHTNSDAGSNEELHNRLFEKLKTIDNDWLIIHSDCELYRDLYSNYNIEEHKFSYVQNFKGNAIKDGKVSHLYISNKTKKSIINF